MSDLPSDRKQPNRKNPAHPSPVQRPNEPVILHVTLCLQTRGPLLNNPRVHAALREVWTKADHWAVGFYLTMPDHIHLFCGPGCHAPVQVKGWVKYWRSLLSRRVPELKGRWLSDCWDTQMRDQEHYLRKLEYVANNPVRQELVALPDEWPYRGRLNELRW